MRCNRGILVVSKNKFKAYKEGFSNLVMKDRDMAPLETKIMKQCFQISLITF